MSLIRWSRTSDIYIFNHVNGLYCLMLAERRHKGEYCGNPLECPDEHWEQILPLGGTTFFFEQHHHLANFLKYLRDSTGIIVPNEIFEKLSTVKGRST